MDMKRTYVLRKTDLAVVTSSVHKTIFYVFWRGVYVGMVNLPPFQWYEIKVSQNSCSVLKLQ